MEKHWIGVVLAVSGALTVVITATVYCCFRKRDEFKSKKLKMTFYREWVFLQLLVKPMQILVQGNIWRHMKDHIFELQRKIGRRVKQCPLFFAEICFVFEILCMLQLSPLLYCRDEDDEARVAFLHSRTWWWNIWCSSRLCMFILVILKTSTCCLDRAVKKMPWPSVLVHKKSNTGLRQRQWFPVFLPCHLKPEFKVKSCIPLFQFPVGK